MNVGRRSGGLGPSNAAATPRALLIVGVAVAIGLLMLWKGLDSSPVAADRQTPALTDGVPVADPVPGATGSAITTEPPTELPDAVVPTSTVPATTEALFPTPLRPAMLARVPRSNKALPNRALRRRGYLNGPPRWRIITIWH